MALPQNYLDVTQLMVLPHDKIYSAIFSRTQQVMGIVVIIVANKHKTLTLTETRPKNKTLI